MNRFGLLLKRQWLEFGKIYLISFGVLLGVLILFYKINITEDNLNSRYYNSLNFRHPLFLVTGFIFISITSSSYFMNLGQKPKAIINILIPASTLEKFLTAMFYTLIVSIPSYLLCFYLVDAAFVSSIRDSHTLTSSYTDYDGKKIVIDHFAYFFSTETAIQFRSFYYMPLLINSIFLLGSIFFKNFHYVKTAISLMVFVVLWIASTIYVMSKLTDNTVWVGSPYWQDETHIFFATNLVALCLTMIFWLITFIRLKEKEA
ncbi:hypothetical protein SAMN04488024_105384 [Pedobacter soli]|uniref:ABC-2 family transporter protein n=2 Tax=Pedobacter soli TaxID=390242 RepID=A0A1G6UKZ0_9SPHI|nr:hypothetical protein SAMN04488024_105384 [Pedobacter soli]